MYISGVKTVIKYEEIITIRWQPETKSQVVTCYTSIPSCWYYQYTKINNEYLVYSTN